jgi:hypothetical protein
LLFLLRIFLVFPAFQFRNHKERSRDFSLLVLPVYVKQGVKLPGGKDGEYIETKLCMFADDTQLFNKNDESVKKSFDILTIYEKASASK